MALLHDRAGNVMYQLPWPEPEVPSYREGRVGEWELARTPAKKRWYAGYFLPHYTHPDGWVIKHGGKNVWMSVTRMEIESHMPHLAAARGDVVVMGLGMGFALYNIARKPEVTSVVLVERDPEILRLFDQITDWRGWPGIEKVTIIEGDALTYQPDREVDFLYADIWPLLGDSRALADTQAIQQNVRARQVGFWGQEIDFVGWIAPQSGGSQRLLANYRRFADKCGLPLIEQNNPRYPSLAYAAATLQILAGAEDQDFRSKCALAYNRFLMEDPLNVLDAVTGVRWR